MVLDFWRFPSLEIKRESKGEEPKAVGTCYGHIVCGLRVVGWIVCLESRKPCSSGCFVVVLFKSNLSRNIRREWFGRYERPSKPATRTLSVCFFALRGCFVCFWIFFRVLLEFLETCFWCPLRKRFPPPFFFLFRQKILFEVWFFSLWRHLIKIVNVFTAWRHR